MLSSSSSSFSLKTLNWKMNNLPNLTMADLTSEERAIVENIDDDKFINYNYNYNSYNYNNMSEYTQLKGAHSNTEPSYRYVGKTVSNHWN